MTFARTIADILSLAIATQKQFEDEKKLQKKSDLLAEMALCTEKFLLSKSLNEMFTDTFEIMGNATQVDHLFYYEKEQNTKLIRQKYKWSKKRIPLQITKLQDFNEEHLSEIIIKAKKKKLLKTKTSKLKNTFFKRLLVANEIKSILIVPIFTTFILGIIYIYVISVPIGACMDWLVKFLTINLCLLGTTWKTTYFPFDIPLFYLG